MSHPIVVELPENLTIAHAEALHEQLEPFANGGDDIVLNGSSVTRADTAGLQTLWAFQKSLRKNNLNLSWQSPSAVLIESAKQLGLTQGLSL